MDSNLVSSIARLRRTENLHILLWLLKDTCWVLDLQIFGLLMIVPTVLVAAWITVRSRFHRAELIHNLAVCLWLCANSIWMIGEFFFKDTTRPYAVVFFTGGLIVLSFHYVPILVKIISGILRRQ